HDLLELSPYRLLLGTQAFVSKPGRLDQREAEQALGTAGSEREARCTAARIANQVESLETGVACCSQHTVDLVVKRVVGWRLGVCVDLEVLRDRFHVLAQRLDQSAVGEVGRHYAAGQQDCLQRHIAASVPELDENGPGQSLVR